MSSSFINKLKNKWNDGKFVCVGLDSDYSKLPQFVKSNSVEDSLFNFNKAIIDVTADLVCAYKINSAFYEAEEVDGGKALEKTCKYIEQNYTDVVLILDAKRGDIGNTNLGYVKMAFDDLGVDAITVHPYLGEKAMKPFLDRKDKGIIVLVRTSNDGSEEFQLVKLEGGRPLYEIVAEDVANINKWNYNGNCAVVVGATYPEELKKVREIVGDMPILVPGIGAQGGDLQATLENGLDSNKQGLIISSSRGIIYASEGDDFAEKARVETEKLHNQIKEILNAD